MQTVQPPEPAPLLTQALSAYWCPKHSGHTINADARMASVFLLLAAELESWAPPEPAASHSRRVLTDAAERLRTSIPPSLRP